MISKFNTSFEPEAENCSVFSLHIISNIEQGITIKIDYKDPSNFIATSSLNTISIRVIFDSQNNRTIKTNGEILC